MLVVLQPWWNELISLFLNHKERAPSFTSIVFDTNSLRSMNFPSYFSNASPTYLFNSEFSSGEEPIIPKRLWVIKLPTEPKSRNKQVVQYSFQINIFFIDHKKQTSNVQYLLGSNKSSFIHSCYIFLTF